MISFVICLFHSFSLDYSCLDDDELEYLGAPWSEYEHCASRTGLDVLRCVSHYVADDSLFTSIASQYPKV